MEIKEILEKLPPAPPGVVRWINDQVIENTYLIYNKKEDWVVCSRCGHKYRASRFNIKNNYTGICPRCKSEGTYKASGIGRKNLTEHFRALVFTHRGNTVYATLTEVSAEFNNPGKPQLSRWLSAVYVFNKNEQSYYKHVPEWMLGSEHWEKRKKIRLPAATGGALYNMPLFWRTEVYEDNIKNVFRNSCLKYGYIPQLLEGCEIDTYEFIRYIDLFLKYHSIELLAKAGFERLVLNKIDGLNGSGCINWRGKSLDKILRLPVRHIRKLRKMDRIDFGFIAYFQELCEEEKLLPEKQLTYAYEAEMRWDIEEVKKKVDIMKWAGWAAKQKSYLTVGDWLDYIDDCKKLGMDTRKKRVLFPDDFDEIHRQLSEKVEVEENREKNEKIKAVAKAYNLKVKDDKFTLKIAASQTDLNMESSALCHCVKTYGDRVAAGMTIIYFIRKKSEPDKPFYTLEINPDGRFVQCRGKNNCSMTKEVEDFKSRVVAEFNRILEKRERSVA